MKNLWLIPFDSPEYTITAIHNQRQKRGGNKRKDTARKDGKLGEREGKLYRKDLSFPERERWDGVCEEGRGAGETRSRGGEKGAGWERGVWREAQVCVTGKRRELGLCTAFRSSSGVFDIGPIGSVFFSLWVQLATELSNGTMSLRLDIFKSP